MLHRTSLVHVILVLGLPLGGFPSWKTVCCCSRQCCCRVHHFRFTWSEQFFYFRPFCQTVCDNWHSGLFHSCTVLYFLCHHEVAASVAFTQREQVSLLFASVPIALFCCFWFFVGQIRSQESRYMRLASCTLNPSSNWKQKTHLLANLNKHSKPKHKTGANIRSQLGDHK